MFWVTDITYIRTCEGFAYLAVVIDLYSRRVIGWAMQSRQTTDVVLQALLMAVWRRKPKDKVLIHSDQGSQFTSIEFIKVLKAAEIAISMDGKGCWRDNVFVERLWRSVKYEEVYLNAYASVPEARAGIGRYIAFYNTVRPHSALGGRTPDQIYFNQPLLAAA